MKIVHDIIKAQDALKKMLGESEYIESMREIDQMIKDVAEADRVAPATVAKAMLQTSKVTEKTRAFILALIAWFGEDDNSLGINIETSNSLRDE